MWQVGCDSEDMGVVLRAVGRRLPTLTAPNGKSLGRPGRASPRMALALAVCLAAAASALGCVADMDSERLCSLDIPRST